MTADFNAAALNAITHTCTHTHTHTHTHWESCMLLRSYYRQSGTVTATVKLNAATAPSNKLHTHTHTHTHTQRQKQKYYHNGKTVGSHKFSEFRCSGFADLSSHLSPADWCTFDLIQQAFSQSSFWLVIVGNSQVKLMTLMLALFHSVSQWARAHNLSTSPDAAAINVIEHSCVSYYNMSKCLKRSNTTFRTLICQQTVC